MLVEMRKPESPELQLLLACARAHPAQEDETAIRRLLKDGVDWTTFARKVVDHGLPGLVGHTLARTAPDMIPKDILEAFQTFIVQTRKNNQALLDELAQLMAMLTSAGIETIPFKGPVLASQAYDDVGLRGFRDLDFLIRDGDLSQTIRTLHDFGYERSGNLTETQFNLIHYLQGQELMFKRDIGAVEPHTRLTSIKMVLDIDYDGLWQRAQRQDICGHVLLTMAPEDTLLVLAIHGGKELWWDIKWACDVSDFIASHPQLDWNAIVSRASAQGCLHMLLLATTLARHYLGAKVPEFIVAAETANPIIGKVVERIIARWEAEDPGGPPSNKTLSMDRLFLHDGFARRTSYVVRTLFLPGPQHISLVALPRILSFAYIPLGLAHDFVALPIYRVYEQLLARADRIQDRLAVSPVALALTPGRAETRAKKRRLQQAYDKARRAAAADPSDYAAWINMGEALAGLNRHGPAIACYDRALALVPDHSSTWKKRGRAVVALGKIGRAVKDVPEFDPKDANGWAIQAGYYAARRLHAEAVQASDYALHLDPENEAAARTGVSSRIYACDWSRRDADIRLAVERIMAGSPFVKPLHLKLLADSEEENLRLAQLWTKGIPQSQHPLWRGERYNHDKIRIAYLSTDFRSHPVGEAIVGCFEHHDKANFEVTAISLEHDDGSRARRRIQTAADRFVDVTSMEDAQVATILRGLEIDIAVDLNSLTGAKRTGILGFRPAPLQVNYLGYPGTSGLPFIDYIIADRVLIPEENRVFYTEKVAYLPHTYLPCDETRTIAESTAGRSHHGLPETGFVFASFNNLAKISPEIFDVWMRLLHAVEGSVLWLTGSFHAAIPGLRREAQARGVAPERLIFTRWEKSPEDHLARQRLADLFLDTLPYNAHSTASDALWAGLPVLTCLGHAFHARVAAGLLYAIGLPELVVTSLAEYEQRALTLARDPQQLAAIRQKLARNRCSTPLFDTAGYTRGLESVFRTMRNRQRSGLPPECFTVGSGQ